MLAIGTSKGLQRFERSKGVWSSLGQTLENLYVFSIAPDVTSEASLYAGVRGKGVYHSTDGGLKWTPALPERDVLNVAVARDGTAYAGINPAAVYRKEPQSDRWTEFEAIRAMPTSAHWNFPLAPYAGMVRSIAFSPGEPSTIYAGIEVGGVAISRDGGESWKDSREGLHIDVHSLAVARGAGCDLLFAATGRGIFRSRDGGASWESACEGLHGLYSIPIVAHPKDDRIVYAAAAEGRPRFWGKRPERAATRIYRTTDGGEHWSPAMGGLGDTLPSAIEALAVDPREPDAVYAGTTDGQVFASADKGDSWQLVARDLPLVQSLAVVQTQ